MRCAECGAELPGDYISPKLGVTSRASEPNHEYLHELGATPVLYGGGLVDLVRALAPDEVDAVSVSRVR